MCSEKATSSFKQLRRSYGFDEVAIVPGDVTINPDQTNTDFNIGSFTFSIPFIACFLVLWIVFGLFVVLKEIPHIGNFIGVLILIIPFLINLSSILLCIFSLAALFFVIPAMSLKKKKKLELVKDILKNFRKNIIANISFFIITIFLIFLVLFFKDY